MSAHSARVPEGMSYVNAWYALWKNAQPYGFFKAFPEHLSKEEDAVSTSEKVANLFKNYPINRSPQFYMEYEGGRMVKVHFCQFPKLDVYYYDTNYGAGAAQRALDEYCKIPSDKRFDKNDIYRFSDLKKS